MVAADVYRPAAIDQLRTLGACWIYISPCPSNRIYSILCWYIYPTRAPLSSSNSRTCTYPPAGERIEVEVFSMGVDEDPIVIAKKGLEKAKAEGFTTVIVDTAGRQVIDEPLMKEIKGAFSCVYICICV